MIKEIGSIFPLSDRMLQQARSELNHFTGDWVYYSLCREALLGIAQACADSAKKVLLPAYTCQTVITPFEEEEWRCEYYSIKKNLRIDTDNLLDTVNQHQPSLLIVHPYYGMEFNEIEELTLKRIVDKGVKIIVDLTQCLFSAQNYEYASFIVASYRKWMPIPDGGYLINKSNLDIKQPEMEFSTFVDIETEAMYLRGLYFESGEQSMKDKSISLSKQADRISESNINPHRMSQVAYNILQQEDSTNNQNKRLANYTYLFSHIQENERVHKICHNLNEVTTAPLYFPLYVEDRQKLQKQLAQQAVYAPVLWPLEEERLVINDTIRYIYDHILVIPCDQRYDANDLQRAVEIINQF